MVEGGYPPARSGLPNTYNVPINQLRSKIAYLLVNKYPFANYLNTYLNTLGENIRNIIFTFLNKLVLTFKF